MLSFTFTFIELAIVPSQAQLIQGTLHIIKFVIKRRNSSLITINRKNYNKTITINLSSICKTSKFST